MAALFAVCIKNATHNKCKTSIGILVRSEAFGPLALRYAEAPAARRQRSAIAAYSASLIFCSNMARIGASLGNIASRVFHRRTASALRPSAKSAAPR